ncbi:EscU/YscU/HrcU family type III secretion system export apparatus switch protein [Massilia atriviolacea]|uniref:EscU/YscU/HrcU family type III secretion system export apparatus switch protein n=1 Tax=Massilia atriviolacea TaxID=2495579 RepID=A0A430HFG9_9BURK|nr:EscU/YscU/HrcU family type III secretion system export apparatus switch protein [Massilia atriviolacea]RSZ56278.1 EscU/YscU/HrcU family type III secretion system export apparatus switch protein [Massilia atriviolacea]
MSDEGQDKSQDATPHKLREAQKRGQVSKSVEANYAAVLALLVGVCFASGPAIAQRVLQLARQSFGQAGRTDWASDNIAMWLVQLVASGIAALLPLLLGLVVVAVVVNVSQTGGVFSADPITPDFKRLNPATGLERLFSLKMLYEAARSVAKLALLGLVAWSAMRHLMPDLMKLSYIDARGHAALVLGNVGPLLFKLMLAVLLLALIDVLYTRWDFAKKMRMSHRDITDEHKQKEGDPRIRSRLRQLRNEMLKQSRSARKLPEADVLITNPTHIAIALSYRHGEMPAPKLLAKGSGKLAARMRQAARELNIPIVENRPLARELYKRIGADQYVPEDLYPRVAKILIWVYAMRQGRAGSAA